MDNVKEIIDFDDDYKATIFDRIKWWIQDARFYPRTFITGIKNICKWLPIVWRDRDWDHFYIFQVLKFKIEKQAKYLSDKDRHMNAKRDAEIMMTVVRLIDKVQDEKIGRAHV